jgi:hypothetical protein
VLTLLTIDFLLAKSSTAGRVYLQAPAKATSSGRTLAIEYPTEVLQALVSRQG